MKQLARYWKVALYVVLILLAGLLGRLSQSAGSRLAFSEMQSTEMAGAAGGGSAWNRPQYSLTQPMPGTPPAPPPVAAPGAAAGADDSGNYREDQDKSATERKASSGQDITSLPSWKQDLLNDSGRPASTVADGGSPQGQGPAQPPLAGSGQSGAAKSRLDSWFNPTAYAQDHQVDEKYIVRTGTLEIHTDSVQDSVSKISAIAAKYGGSVTDSSVSKDDSGHHSGTITLRVPAPKFFDAWNELAKIGELINQSMQSSDVGQDYVSSVSHMKTLVAEQATLQKMLDEALAVQRSRGLGEAYSVLLDTQSRLSDVTEEIRGVEDKLNVLSDQITRSSITITLSENPTIPAAKDDKFNWGYSATFRQAIRDVMETVKGLSNGILYFVVSLQWVWWLLIFLAGRWVWRRWQKYQQTPRKAKDGPENTGGGR